jgi:hypothetical protein
VVTAPSPKCRKSWLGIEVVRVEGKALKVGSGASPRSTI